MKLIKKNNNNNNNTTNYLLSANNSCLSFSKAPSPAFESRTTLRKYIYILKSIRKTDWNYIYTKTYLIGSLGCGVNKGSDPEFATQVGGL